METYKDLEKGARIGYAKGWNNLTENHKVTTQIRRNLYLFSGAKASEQLKKFNEFLVDENGKIQDWTSFKRKVLAEQKNYNVNYLQAEHQTAKRSANAAKKWQQFVKDADLFPNLLYRTIGDDRVRDEHDKLDGIIKPINDTFWDKHYPPNGFRCRCAVQQTTKSATKGAPKVNIDKGFSNNVGKTGSVFDENGHPYFAQPLKDTSFKEQFELMKLKTPLIKTKGIHVSPWADVNDLASNLRVALLLRKRLKDAIIINAHIERKGWKNPEFTINGIKGDLKAIKSHKGIKNGLDASKLQGAEITLFNLDGIENLSIEAIIREVKRKVNKGRGESVKFIYFIKGDTVVKLSRKQLINNEFEDLIKAIKSDT